MPRFILICESTAHTCFVTQDELVKMLDARFNPGGWTNLDRTLAIMAGQDEDNPTPGKFYGIPFDMEPLGRHTIHVDGKMDLEKKRFSKPCPYCGKIAEKCAHRKPLVWKEAGHRCVVRCVFDERLNKKTEESIAGIW